jgi:cobalamin biosynthesis Mg chelatase CobN
MSGAGVSETAAPGAVSVAEISSRYKAEKGARNARILGNDDVEKMLANKGGVTMAKNMPPLGPGALEQGGQPQTAGAQTAGTQTAATSGGRQSASANQQATPPVSSQGQSTAPDASAENSTTPRVNQNQQSNDAQGSRRLPATAGFLPLLGLLGLASGGIGLWFRKFRK